MPISTREFSKAILEAYRLLEVNKVTEPHVPIKEIAKKLLIEVIPYFVGDNVSGILISKGDNATIGYNPNDPDVRQRFTIAHELGHYILHRKEKITSEQLFVDRDFIVKYRSTSKYTDSELLQEQQANAFAAAILMPERLIRKELRKKDYETLNEAQVIGKLADVFKVSEIAMTYKMTNLNIEF